jgi:hypothetical protein
MSVFGGVVFVLSLGPAVGALGAGSITAEKPSAPRITVTVDPRVVGKLKVSGTFSPNTRVTPCLGGAYRPPLACISLGGAPGPPVCCPLRPFGPGVFRLAAPDGWGGVVVTIPPSPAFGVPRLRGSDSPNGLGDPASA